MVRGGVVPFSTGAGSVGDVATPIVVITVVVVGPSVVITPVGTLLLDIGSINVLEGCIEETSRTDEVETTTTTTGGFGSGFGVGFGVGLGSMFSLNGYVGSRTDLKDDLTALTTLPSIRMYNFPLVTRCRMFCMDCATLNRLVGSTLNLTTIL